MSVKTAAAFLKVTRGYVRNLVRIGSIQRAEQIDERTYLLNRESVEAFHHKERKRGRPSGQRKAMNHV